MTGGDVAVQRSSPNLRISSKPSPLSTLVPGTFRPTNIVIPIARLITNAARSRNSFPLYLSEMRRMFRQRKIAMSGRLSEMRPATPQAVKHTTVSRRSPAAARDPAGREAYDRLEAVPGGDVALARLVGILRDVAPEVVERLLDGRLNLRGRVGDADPVLAGLRFGGLGLGGRGFLFLGEGDLHPLLRVRRSVMRCLSSAILSSLRR